MYRERSLISNGQINGILGLFGSPSSSPYYRAARAAAATNLDAVTPTMRPRYLTNSYHALEPRPQEVMSIQEFVPERNEPTHTAVGIRRVTSLLQ